jgi:hypothetical protein
MIAPWPMRRVTMGVLALALLLPFLPLFAAPALAKTITVCPSGCTFTTIAAALNAAKDGDRIQIGPGNYAGGLIITKNVDLAGAGRGLTTITGTSLASVIRVRRGANVSLEEVTITGGGGSFFGDNRFGGGGILNEGELALFGVVVRDNAVTQGPVLPPLMVGGGIVNATSKHLRIFNSVIRDNQAGVGAGIYNSAGDMLVSDTLIAGNTTFGGGNGAGVFIVNNSKSSTLRRVEVTGNATTGEGGGIFASGELVVIDSRISGNTAMFAGGGVKSSGEELQIIRTTISGNAVDPQQQGLGGGVVVGVGGAMIQESTIENNRSANGAGIATGQGDLTLKHTTVANNVAQARAGGLFIGRAEVVLNASHIIDNSAGTQGGGIYAEDSTGSSLALRNGSTVTGNQPDQCVGVTCTVKGAKPKRR